jgi:hypothetical protein
MGLFKFPLGLLKLIWVFRGLPKRCLNYLKYLKAYLGDN